MTGRDFDKTAVAVATQTFAERLGRGEAKPETAAAGEQAAGSGPYKPYGFLPTGSGNETCDIQGWVESTEVAQGIEVPYRFVTQIQYFGEEQIKLFLPDCIVVIDGMYLRDLRRKLARRQVTFVQQYSSRVWKSAPPKGEPIVEKISIVRPETPERRGRNS
ncbi:MAG: hypothetical protein JSR60_18625 [Proteobacteria bacterium]|nr:hypothetical protein [Pseudomonadota bacterium]